MSDEFIVTPTKPPSASFLPPLWILSIFGCAGLAWLFYALKEMFVLLILGYYTAYIFDPLLDKLVSWRLKRTHAVILVVAGLVAITSIALLTVVPSLLEDGARLISNLPKYSDIARQELISLALSLEHRLPAPLATKLHGLAIEDLASLLSGEFIGEMGRGLVTALFKGYSLTLTLVNLLLLPFIVFYLSVSFDDYHHYALSSTR